MKRYFRYALIYLALIMSAVSVRALYYWGTRWVDERNYADLTWAEYSSPTMRYQSLKNMLSRKLIFLPDNNIYYPLVPDILMFGGKDVLELIMGYSEDEIQVLLDDRLTKNMMCGLVNDDLGTRAADWRAWWRNNSPKSQYQIFLSGFQKRNLVIPDQEYIPTVRLLCVIGSHSPGSWQAITAMRWLRDTGVGDKEIKLAAMLDCTEDVIIAGIYRFGNYLGGIPRSEVPIDLRTDKFAARGAPWTYTKEITSGVKTLVMIAAKRPLQMRGLFQGDFSRMSIIFLSHVPGTRQMIHMGMYERFLISLYLVIVFTGVGLIVYLFRGWTRKWMDIRRSRRSEQK